MHPGQMHQPMPLPTPQLPVEMEASPMMPKMPMQREWQMIESPNIQFEEDVKFQRMPNIHFESED